MKFWDNFLNLFALKNSGHIWAANPLLILNQDEEVLFAGRADIQATHLGESHYQLEFAAETGQSFSLSDAKTYFVPEAGAAQLQGYYELLQRGNRGGSGYEGVGADGRFQIWLIGSAADAFLLARNYQN